MRTSIKLWAKRIREKANGICSVTGEAHKAIDVHHLISFADILNISSEETGVPIFTFLSEYKDINDFYRLRDSFVKKHTDDVGIAIGHSLHMKFHFSHPKMNATKEQFNEYILENYGVSLKDVMGK